MDYNRMRMKIDDYNNVTEVRDYTRVRMRMIIL